MMNIGLMQGRNGGGYNILQVVSDLSVRTVFSCIYIFFNIAHVSNFSVLTYIRLTS